MKFEAKITGDCPDHRISTLAGTIGLALREHGISCGEVFTIHGPSVSEPGTSTEESVCPPPPPNPPTVDDAG